MNEKDKTGKNPDLAHLAEFPFKRKKLNETCLIPFGFVEQDEKYVWSTPVSDGQFLMTVFVTKTGEISTKLLDPDSGEEYVLHRDPLAKGAFVGKIRMEYGRILELIANKCFENDVFQSDYAHKVIRYVRQTYGDELEFLWERFPDNAILRRKDTGKWYGALLVLSRRKLGLASDDLVDILDLRIKSGEIETLVDKEKFFPGYHMNKKHWFTVCLDGSVPMEEIFRRIDDSYLLAKK